MIEVVISIALVALLAGVLTFGMFGRTNDAYLTEGADRFETTLRMARADAANRGRRMRLTFAASDLADDDDARRMWIEWEPQPLAQPGQFIEYTQAAWTASLPNELVDVARCQLTGSATLRTMTFEESAADRDAGVQRQAIEFYPDGSSDSALIVLSSRDQDDMRRAVIVLDGVNGLIKTQIIVESQLDQWLEQFFQDTAMPTGRKN